jgi:hypothetical protein
LSAYPRGPFQTAQDRIGNLARDALNFECIVIDKESMLYIFTLDLASWAFDRNWNEPICKNSITWENATERFPCGNLYLS